MAVAHPIPTCSFCGKPTATGRYKDQSGIPEFMRLIGDTFLGWTYKDCNCKGAKKGRKELKKKMQEYDKEHPFDLKAILDKKKK